MTSESDRRKLRHVYWLGGSPCSGKSTLAGGLARMAGVDVYHVDEAVRLRFGPYDADSQPCLYRWTAQLENGEVTWDELWMRPVEALLAEVLRCYAEQFELVLADLLASPPQRPLIVEGNPLLPAAVIPLLSHPSHALWMVAAEQFQRRVYPQRGAWVQEILRGTSDPARALQNWMDRDVAFARLVAAQVEDADGALLTVDGTRSIEQNHRTVAAHFALAIDCET